MHAMMLALVSVLNFGDGLPISESIELNGVPTPLVIPLGGPAPMLSNVIAPIVALEAENSASPNERHPDTPGWKSPGIVSGFEPVPVMGVDDDSIPRWLGPRLARPLPCCSGGMEVLRTRTADLSQRTKEPTQVPTADELKAIYRAAEILNRFGEQNYSEQLCRIAHDAERLQSERLRQIEQQIRQLTEEADQLRADLGVANQIQLRFEIVEVQREKFVARMENKNRLASTLPTGGVSSIRDVVHDMLMEGTATSIAAPCLITHSGKEANLVSGGEYAIPVPQNDNSQRIEWAKFGTEITCRPRQIKTDSIECDLDISLSELNESTSVVFNGVKIPGKVKRSLSTRFNVSLGETKWLEIGCGSTSNKLTLCSVTAESTRPEIAEIYQEKSTASPLTPVDAIKPTQVTVPAPVDDSSKAGSTFLPVPSRGVFVPVKPGSVNNSKVRTRSIPIPGPTSFRVPAAKPYSGYYFRDDVQYFPDSPAKTLQNQAQNLERYRGDKQKAEKTETPRAEAKTQFPPTDIVPTSGVVEIPARAEMEINGTKFEFRLLPFKVIEPAGPKPNSPAPVR